VALSALIGAWLAGTLGGAHCVAMCGGFVAAMSGGGQSRAGGGGSELLPARALIRRQLAHNGGRITTYAVLGAVAGGAGGALLAAADWVPLQRSLYLVANLFLLALAFGMVSKRGGVAWLQRAGIALFGKTLPAVRPLLAANSFPARYALGMIWGLVPCALLYSVLAVALFAGGALEGTAVMLAFGLGTLPNLLAAGWIVSRAGGWLDRRIVRLAAAALLAGFAAVGIWRALVGTASLAQGPFCF
jgi:sulfite exporter TauE/SafE